MTDADRCSEAEAEMAKFEDVTWFCDKCGACLNAQSEFADERGIWYCEQCGYLNELKESEIYDSEEAWRRSETYRRLYDR